MPAAWSKQHRESLHHELQRRESPQSDLDSDRQPQLIRSERVQLRLQLRPYAMRVVGELVVVDVHDGQAAIAGRQRPSLLRCARGCAVHFVAILIQPKQRFQLCRHIICSKDVTFLCQPPLCPPGLDRARAEGLQSWFWSPLTSKLQDELPVKLVAVAQDKSKLATRLHAHS